MDNEADRSPSTMTKAEMRERLVGPERAWHEEEIAFWRTASDEVRGRVLYELLARGEAIRAGVGAFPQERMCMILHPGRIEVVPRE